MQIKPQRAPSPEHRTGLIVPCSDGYPYTAPVGSFLPNAFALHDMHGNAWQWVEDCWHDNYTGAPANGSARLSDACKVHVVRGGAWWAGPSGLRSATRGHNPADNRHDYVGFRLGRTLEPLIAKETPSGKRDRNVATRLHCGECRRRGGRFGSSCVGKRGPEHRTPEDCQLSQSLHGNVMDVEESGRHARPGTGDVGKKFRQSAEPRFAAGFSGIGRHRGARDQYANRVH